MSTTLALAERIAGAGYERVPADAREVACQAIMDFLGVAIAGMNEPLTRILRDAAEDEGGYPQAHVLGSAARVSMTQAALINGAAGHAHDYDDVHNAMSGHPTVPVAPAVLSLGERLGRSGAEIVSAFCAGLDTECILGRYAGPSHYARGWHNTGTLGSFGAAAACARLYRLDALATAQALGIAGTQAAGLKSQFGTMCKPLHAGHAAATGLGAATLARRGFTSCPDILENEQGFMATQSDGASTSRFQEAMAVPAYAQDICFKYHAACYLTHSAIEATRALSERNAFDPQSVTDIEVRVDKGHLKVCNILEPRTGLEAKFSLRLTTAMALTGINTASIEIFDDALAADPALLRYRDLVRVVPHEHHDPNTIVRITSRTGDIFEESCNVAVPMRDLTAQWRKLESKFLTLATPVIGSARAERAVAACRNLDAAQSLDEVLTAVCGAAA